MSVIDGECNYFYEGPDALPVQLDTCSYSTSQFSSGYYCRDISNETYVIYIEFDGENCPNNMGERKEEYPCDDYDCNCDGDPDDCKVAKVTKKQFISASDTTCNSSTTEIFYYAYDICFNRGIAGGQHFQCDENGVSELYYDNDDCSGDMAHTPSPTIAHACYEIGCNWYKSEGIGISKQIGFMTYLYSFIFCMHLIIS